MPKSSRERRNILIIIGCVLLFAAALIIALLPNKKIAPAGIPSYSASSNKNAATAATNAFDENPETAWIPAKTQDPRYEWIQVDYSSPQIVSGMRMVNGYGGEKGNYRFGAKIRTARILLSDYASYYWTFKEDVPEMQSISFAKKHEVEWIRLFIHSIYKGVREPAEEVGISEIEVY